MAHTALRLLSARQTPPVSACAKTPRNTRAHRRRVTLEPGVSAAFAMSLRAIWSRRLVSE